MDDVLAIIQAHTGSSRLPGKVLLDLSGKTVLERVIARTQACKRIGRVVVATSTLACDDVLEALCKKLAIDFHRGDRTAFKTGEQNAAQRITNGMTIALFKRFGGEFSVRVRERCPISSYATGNFQTRCFRHRPAPGWSNLDKARNPPKPCCCRHY